MYLIAKIDKSFESATLIQENKFIFSLFDCYIRKYVVITLSFFEKVFSKPF